MQRRKSGQWWSIGAACLAITCVTACGLIVGLKDRQLGEDGGMDAGSDGTSAGEASPDSSMRRPCTNPGDCDDMNPCTVDLCGGDNFCTSGWEKNGTSCADGVFCNGIDTCNNGVCVHPGNPCTVPSDCDEIMIVDGGGSIKGWCRCTDNNECTANDHWTDGGGGSCVGTNAKDTLCGGSTCGSSGCKRCCGGQCIDLTKNQRCGNCDHMGCSGAEFCGWANGNTPCGWLWCCCNGSC